MRSGTTGPPFPCGEASPYADVPDETWAQPERSRHEARYCTAAVRAGELLLASGAVRDAIDAGERAIATTPTAEPAYRLVARGHLAHGDQDSARRTMDRCRTALAQLDLDPDPHDARARSNPHRPPVAH